MEIIKKNSFTPPALAAPELSGKGNGSLDVLSIGVTLVLGAFIAYLLREELRRKEGNNQYF